MKKRIIKTFITAIVMACCLHVSANPALSFFSSIPLSVRAIDPSDPIRNPHRSPINIPEIGMDEHTIYFITSCDGCLLRIVNEESEVVYSTEIPTDCESLELPNLLEGEYELQIIRGHYLFYGYIEL